MSTYCHQLNPWNLLLKSLPFVVIYIMFCTWNFLNLYFKLLQMTVPFWNHKIINTRITLCPSGVRFCVNKSRPPKYSNDVTGSFLPVKFNPLPGGEHARHLRFTFRPTFEEGNNANLRFFIMTKNDSSSCFGFVDQLKMLWQDWNSAYM